MYFPARRLRLVLPLLSAAVVGFAVFASDFAFTSSGTDVTARIDEKFVDPISIVYPPGSNFHFRADLGFLVFDPATFDATNLLAAPTAFGAATVFPVSVSETNGTGGRERQWSAGSGVVWMTLPPATYNTTSAVESVFGACPAWEDLATYVAERDPWRQTVTLTLVGTDNVDAVEAVLSNAMAAVQGGGNTNFPWTTNDLAFISLTAAADGASGYAFVPTNVPLFDLFGTTNLIAEPLGGWYLRGQQTRSGNPMAFTLGGIDLAFLALGSMVDTDQDGLTDARERLLTGTSTTNADTDADGLEDGQEFLQYRTDPQNQDSDGDGLLDGWEVANGLSPLAWHDANSPAANGVPFGILQDIGGSPSDRVVNVSAGGAEVEMCRLTSRRSLTNEAVEGFARTGGYYQAVSFSALGGWGLDNCFPTNEHDGATVTVSIASTFLSQTNCAMTWTASGTLSANAYASTETFDPPTFGETSRTCNSSWFTTNAWGADFFPYQGPVLGYVVTTSCTGSNTADQCTTVSNAPGALPRVMVDTAPNVLHDTTCTWAWVSGYTTGETGPEIWHSLAAGTITVVLSDLLTVDELAQEVVGDIATGNTTAWAGAEWGGNALAVSDCGSLDACTADDIAVKRTDGSNAVARAGFFRLRLTSSNPGFIYRAAAVRQFTPEGGSPTNSAPVLFYAKGNGDAVVMRPTNGVFVGVPAEKGCIAIKPVTVHLPQDLAFCWTASNASLSSLVSTQFVEGDSLVWSLAVLEGATNAELSPAGVLTFGSSGGRYVATAASSLLPDVADRTTITVVRIEFTNTAPIVAWTSNGIVDARAWLHPDCYPTQLVWESETVSGGSLVSLGDGRFRISTNGGAYNVVAYSGFPAGCSATTRLAVLRAEILSIEFTSDHEDQAGQNILQNYVTDFSGTGEAFAEPEWSQSGSCAPISHTVDKSLSLACAFVVEPLGIEFDAVGQSSSHEYIMLTNSAVATAEQQVVALRSVSNLQSVVGISTETIVWAISAESVTIGVGTSGPHRILMTYSNPVGSECTLRRLEWVCDVSSGASNRQGYVEAIHQRTHAETRVGNPPTADGWSLLDGVPKRGDCDNLARCMKVAVELLGITPATVRLVRASSNAGIGNCLDFENHPLQYNWFLVMDFDPNPDQRAWNLYEGACVVDGKYYAIYPFIRADNDYELLKAIPFCEQVYGTVEIPPSGRWRVIEAPLPPVPIP